MARRTLRLAAGLGVLAAGCQKVSEPGGQGSADLRSVLLITLDTTRQDALTCYGGPEGLTPHLDRLAAEGVLYETARTVAPTTLPAHASMLTGLYPLRHGVHVNGIEPLSEAAVTVAELARDAGIDTAAFVSAVVLDEAYGLDQGFELYDQVPRSEFKQAAHFEAREARAVADAAVAWLGARPPRKPFFAWVHFFDPHLPYIGRPRFNETARGNPYLAEVGFMDHHIGRIVTLLEERGELDHTLVIVAGDHGEAFGDHGEDTHGLFCYEAVMLAPLIVRHPDMRRAGERSRETVSVVDVAPTICAALGLTLADSDGQSLYRGRVFDDRGVYVQSLYGYSNYGWSPIVGWVDARGKYLFSSRPEYYDLAQDPGERHNLVAEADVSGYHRALAEGAARPRLEQGSELALDDDLASEMSDLGYVLGNAPEIVDILDPGARPAPLDSAEELAAIQRAFDVAANRPPLEAADAWQAVLELNPDNPTAMGERAYQLVRASRWAEAAPLYAEVLRRGQTRTMNYMNYGVCLEQLGDREAAIEQYRLAVECDSRNLLALDHLARALSLEGRLGEAERVRAQRATAQR